MFKHMKVLAALGIGLTALLGNGERSMAQQSPVTAIDIALRAGRDDDAARAGRQRSPAQVLPEGLCSGRDAPRARHDAAAVRPHG